MCVYHFIEKYTGCQGIIPTNKILTSTIIDTNFPQEIAIRAVVSKKISNAGTCLSNTHFSLTNGVKRCTLEPMIIGKVVGSVWATRKEIRLEGFKLLIVQETQPTGAKTNNYHIAADLVDAGKNDTVLVVRGSSARQTEDTKDKPLDAIIVGVIDRIDLEIPPKK